MLTLTKPTISISECCEVLRANRIKISSLKFKAILKNPANACSSWAVYDADKDSFLISAIGFCEWAMNFFRLPHLYGIDTTAIE